MEFPPVTLAQWRALVDKELAGGAFDKLLFHEVTAGVRIAPLYTQVPSGDLQASPARELPARAFRICMRQEPGASAESIVADAAAGADAVWLKLSAVPGGVFARDELARTFVVFDTEDEPTAEVVARVMGQSLDDPRAGFALNLDPLARCATGRAGYATLPEDLAAVGRVARHFEQRSDGATAAMVSTLPYHDAGADVADELAIALSTCAAYLEALLQAGLTPDRAARQLAVQLAVGRDTFLELCKLRALRVCLRKLLTASGVTSMPKTLVHAVCSARTLTVRDPWVNMLRVTTQVFAAILGGADLITPNAFDQAFGSPSAHGRRVARNTGLVLREESLLGQVADPTGGAYYFESLTDALAREGWRRFQLIEGQGGIAAELQSGRLAARLAAAWQKQLELISKRKVPILGVSEFANLGETLPQPVPRGEAPRRFADALPVHRDAAAFEALRARADAQEPAPEALLVTLGTVAESRPRVGFAAGFFAAGGIHTRESATDQAACIACLCGTDERYAAEAAARARALKAAGCSRVLVAGRPGALEGSLREAGVDGFIYVGCDAVATLAALLEIPS